MDAQKIQARIELLENERLRALSQLNAIEGAVQDCKFWLQQLTSPPIEQPLAQDMKVLEGGTADD